MTIFTREQVIEQVQQGKNFHQAKLMFANLSQANLTQAKLY